MRFTCGVAATLVAIVLAAALPGRARAEGPLGPLADDPTLIALAVSLACADAPESEAVAPPAASPPADTGPELELVAVVRAKSLRFEQVPRVDVKFRGPTHRTVWKTERVNLPIHPEPGVVYHDVAVRLTISSSIDELGELISQAKRASRGITLEPDDASPPAAKAVPAPAAAASPAVTPAASSAAPR
jgi:hypothetical protein